MGNSIGTVFFCCLIAGLTACTQEQSRSTPTTETLTVESMRDSALQDADVLIIGAGLAGLSAAIDAANGGARVLVVDMNSVFGGHGIQSGGVAIVGSPMQEELGFSDTPEQAFIDWMDWTIDGHPEWMRFYTENSREMIYDWVTGLGVRFDRVRPSHGNSIPRFHMTYRRGLNLIRPIYLEALRYSNISFRFNSFAEHLITEDGTVVGVEGIDWRAGKRFELRAQKVIIATGGFQSNIAMVKANWRSDLPVSGDVYSMSGQNSRGTGHRMAEEVGAVLVNLNRQYNGYTVIPNVLGLDADRGFTAGNARSIWVNSQGKRFVTEGGIDRFVFEAVMQQPEGYWAIFDEDDKHGFRIGGPHFISADEVDYEKIQRLGVDNPAITQKAETLVALAELISIPPAALTDTVAHFNQQVLNGETTDVDGLEPEDQPPTFSIDTPPYYATRLYPMANKSAGGISIDLQTHALDADGRVVAGLYAAGEVTGSAGINGLNGLDGMFTGPSILTGRVAGATAAAELAASNSWTPAAFTREDGPLASTEVSQHASDWLPNLGKEQLRALLAASPRDGFWHFERVHNLVLERDYECAACHSDQVPFYTATSRVDKFFQAQVCDTCHLTPSGTLEGMEVGRAAKSDEDR